ncbi:MAG TPA: hypothetical protein VNZ05_05640 [Solirubrobacteraceae bacterium]|jgi:hypothetical protein|nr:hypothetical protein [Solirubrobacteraceae bacterium]
MIDLDAAIEKLEADLATLRRARSLLTDEPPPARRLSPLSRAIDRALVEPAAAAPSSHAGRSRAAVAATYAALVPFAGGLEPKMYRAIKMRGAGKLRREIASTMKITTQQVDKLLSTGRLKAERARQAGGAPAPAASSGDAGDDPEPEPEPAPLSFPDQILVDNLRTAYPPPAPTVAAPTSGVNELVELRLEKLRQRQGGPPPVYEVGSIVVVSLDERAEVFARVVENLDNGMTRVWLVDRRGKDRGRRAHNVVAGEILRLASKRETSRGTTRYELDETAEAATA